MAVFVDGGLGGTLHMAADKALLEEVRILLNTRAAYCEDKFEKSIEISDSTSV